MSENRIEIKGRKVTTSSKSTVAVGLISGRDDGAVCVEFCNSKGNRITKFALSSEAQDALIGLLLGRILGEEWVDTLSSVEDDGGTTQWVLVATADTEEWTVEERGA